MFRNHVASLREQAKLSEEDERLAQVSVVGGRGAWGGRGTRAAPRAPVSGTSATSWQSALALRVFSLEGRRALFFESIPTDRSLLEVACYHTVVLYRVAAPCCHALLLYRVVVPCRHSLLHSSDGYRVSKSFRVWVWRGATGLCQRLTLLFRLTTP